MRVYQALVWQGNDHLRRLGTEPLRAIQLSDRVYEEIEAAIVRWELRPGELLTDRRLAPRLGVSRTPVREALQRLAGLGLVVPTGRGWAVASFDERDVRDLFELRRPLEVIGLTRLLSEPDQATVAELAGYFDAYGEHVPPAEFPGYFARDHAFHKRIVAASRNRHVIGCYAVVERQIDRGRHFLSTGRAGRVDANLAEHRAITRAIGARDLDAARAALLHHLGRGEALMLEHLRTVRARGTLGAATGADPSTGMDTRNEPGAGAERPVPRSVP
jgi:DNA-binding GntR family transcriptional regulator